MSRAHVRQALREVTGISRMVRTADGLPMWVKSTREKEPIDVAAVLEALPKKLRAPVVPAPRRGKRVKGLDIIAFGDPHFGQLSWRRECGQSWDLDKSLEAHRAAFADLLHRGEQVDEALIWFAGDNTHANDDSSMTPRSRHLLDTDGRHVRTFERVLRLIAEMTEQALQKYRKVTLCVLRGNHDPDTSALLRAALAFRFERTRRLDVLDNAPVALYWRYADNLLGFHHGHTMSPQQFAAAMLADNRAVSAQHYYALLGHFHHSRRAKVFASNYSINEGGVQVEIMPTLTAHDAYAASKHYRSMRAATKIHLHPQQGEVARYLHRRL